MTRAVTWLATLWTMGGAVFFFQGEAGSPPWWDVAWVLLLAMAAYLELVEVGGLAKARMFAGITLVVFGGMILLTALTGWPFGPIRFTGPEALRLGNVFPLLPPLVLFAWLALCQRTLAVAFPDLGTGALASLVAGVFTLTVANGLIFLCKVRLWWLWNPWDAEAAWSAALFGLASLAAAAFFLSRIHPEDTALKLSRWSPAAAPMVAINLLFFAANAATFFVKK
jgi:hypothetical protein